MPSLLVLGRWGLGFWFDFGGGLVVGFVLFWDEGGVCLFGGVVSVLYHSGSR